MPHRAQPGDREHGRLAHSARTERREDLVRAEFSPSSEAHFFNKAVQLGATLIGIGVVSESDFKRRKRWPSAVTAY